MPRQADFLTKRKKVKREQGVFQALNFLIITAPKPMEVIGLRFL